ncbi:UDP-glucuronosyltransferase 3A1-like [Leptodactylus fuscus]|uniref:UDP-glucuronosyltransferase 3A1-like n=1 Tax=Leptodactylus fuscus TaxID=238119 RepID=UPI003F4E4D81
MAGGWGSLKLVLLLVLHLHGLQGAKILTICFVSGSHFLLMDEISRILQDNGHDVRMFRQIGYGDLPGNDMSTPYAVTSYTMEKEFLKENEESFKERQKKLFSGRVGVQYQFRVINLFADHCQIYMNQTDILDFLKQQKYDIAIIDAFNPCHFLVAEKLGLPYIAFFPGLFINSLAIGLPSPPSYVPTFRSFLTDRMNFLGRLKNTFMYLDPYMVEKKNEAIFRRVIERHFPADSRPSLLELYQKAELWLYNADFSIEFARPLLPHVQCIGGLLAKPANPVSQDIEDFIAKSGESGFIVMTLGSLISSIPRLDLVKEINSAFANIPQKVIWRYKTSQWPKDVKLAPNVRLMDWVNQNDLLGHPKIRLLVTHGGLNSLTEAVYHGVPVLGIPLFGDQFDNLVRIKAKRMGEYIPPNEIKSENFADAIRKIVENKSYKTSAMKQRAILRSRPFPPDKQLVGWVEHIIQSGGGSHLKPYSYQQPWYQHYLLDVILLISACVSVTICFIVKIIILFARLMSSSRKKKPKPKQN